MFGSSSPSQGTGGVFYQENGSDGWSGWFFSPGCKVISDGSLVLPESSKRGLAIAPYGSPDSLSDFVIETEMRFLEMGRGYVGITAYGSFKHDLWQGYMAGMASVYSGSESWSFGKVERKGWCVTLGAQIVRTATHKVPAGYSWFEDFQNCVPYHYFYFDPGKSWHVLQLVIRGNEIELWIDGTVLGRTSDYHRDRQYLYPGNLMGLWCRDIAINVRSFKALALGGKDELPLKEKSSSPPPSLGETILTDLTSREVTAIVNVTAIATALIGTFTYVAKQWSKKHSTDSAGLQVRSSQPSETDIVAIRLRMSHGPDHEFEEWLTDPDRLRHYIDVFNQSSNSIQPLHATFVQRNGRAIKVDVSKGTQDNLQLNEVLSYLHIDSAEK